MCGKSNSVAVSRISIFLVFFTVNSLAQNGSCPSSSCGSIRISYPFTLTFIPESCGVTNPSFKLECLNNQTILEAESTRYVVQDINYESYSIRLVDPSINAGNLSSCPLYSNGPDVWPTIYSYFFEWNVPITFISCLAPVNSSEYVEGPLCGNRSRNFSRPSRIYSYLMVGYRHLSDVEELCTIDRVVWTSGRKGMKDNSSLAAIYDYMARGVELSWYRALCRECEGRDRDCSLEGNRIICKNYCAWDTPLSQQSFKCKSHFLCLLILSLKPTALSCFRWWSKIPSVISIVLLWEFDWNGDTRVTFLSIF